MKNFYKLVVALVAMVSITGCGLRSEDKSAQKELINNFLEVLYSYEYNEENMECSKEGNDICQETINKLHPYLALNSTVNRETVYNLIVKPAVYSEVSVGYDSSTIEKLKTYNGNTIYSYHVLVNALVKNEKLQLESIIAQPSVAINLVKEADGWKVDSLDFMADDYLFAQ